MDKTQIEQTLNTLTMVTGYCPYEKGLGTKDEINCEAQGCVSCWKKALYKALKEIEE